MAAPETQTDCPREGLPFLCRAALAVSIGTVLLFVLGLTVLFVLLWFVHHRHLANWGINLVGLTLVSGALSVFWRTMRSLARRHYRFSLRASLAGMAVLGLALGMLGNRIRFVARQQQAVWSLWRQGSSTNYYLNFNTDSAWFRWLIEHFGFDPFGRILEVDARTDGAIEALAGHRAEFVDVENVFFGPGVTDRGLEYVAELRDFPNLKNANFRGSPITDAGLKRLAGWKNLRFLALNSCPRITDAGLAHLVDLPDIEGLALVAKSTTMGLIDAGLVHVGRMSRLQFLNVGGIAISDAGLAQLRGLSRLERLVIRNANITDAGLQHISALNIKFLLLAQTGITDAGAEHLKQMTQLETLCFRGPGIGDETLLRLQKLPKLKSLVLDSTNVTDDGLQYLPGLAALEELALWGPAFTDAGLQHLHSLRRLRHLQADSRNFTPAAVETLRAVLPECRIEVY